MADEVGLGLRGVAKLAEGERRLIPETGANPEEPPRDKRTVPLSRSPAVT